MPNYYPPQGMPPEFNEENYNTPEFDPIHGRNFANQFYPVQNFQPQPSPGMRIGPARISGAGLDSASLAMLSALRNMPQPNGFGPSLLAGLAGGYSQARYNRALERGEANKAGMEGAAKSKEKNASEASEYARGLATHRHSMARLKYEQEQINARSQQRPEAKAKTLQEIEDEAYARAKGQRRGAPLQTQAESQPADEDIDPVIEQIYNLKFDPAVGQRVTKEATAMRRRMAQLHPDFNWSQRIQQWNDATKFVNTAESQRFRSVRTAGVTFARHLKEYEDFNADFDQVYRRLPQRFLNRGIMWAAQNGMLGEEAAERSAALVPVRGAVASELATLLSSGYAPQKEQIEEAHKAVDLLWSPRQQRGAIGGIRALAKDRIRSAQEAQPWGKDNPYMLEVTPIDVLGESIGGAASTPAPTPTKPSSGGWFDKNKRKLPRVP